MAPKSCAHSALGSIEVNDMPQAGAVRKFANELLHPVEVLHEQDEGYLDKLRAAIRGLLPCRRRLHHRKSEDVEAELSDVALPCTVRLLVVFVGLVGEVQVGPDSALVQHQPDLKDVFVMAHWHSVSHVSLGVTSGGVVTRRLAQKASRIAASWVAGRNSRASRATVRWNPRSSRDLSA